MLDCGSVKLLFLSTPGATWAGGWRRSQLQSRIPIGLSEDSFFCLFSFLIAAIFSRFALNDAGRSMVTALVARILEDPQLGDEQINLSWTTTIGEVCNDMP